MKKINAISSTWFSINIIILSFLIVNSCPAQTPIIAGEISGLGSDTVQIWYVHNGKREVDTIYSKNDCFLYYPKPSDDSTLKIYLKNATLFSCWIEPGKTKISGSMDKKYNFTLKGGLENNILNEYNSEIEFIYKDLMRDKPDSLRKLLAVEKGIKTITFIKQHPFSRQSADLLYWQTLFDDSNVQLYDTLLNGLDPAVIASKQGKKINKRLEVIRNQPRPGMLAPEFTLSDTLGKSVSLLTLRGQYVLLDFWGHWCGPCVQAFPLLKSLHKRFLKKIVFVGIAAEKLEDREKWTNMIQRNSLNWIQLSEFKADKGFVNDAYYIAAFPTYFLIDKNGIIVIRSNSLNNIQEAINNLQ